MIVVSGEGDANTFQKNAYERDGEDLEAAIR